MGSLMFNPLHPGQILRGCYYGPAEAYRAADVGIGYQDLAAVWERKQDITPELSAKLDHVFGKSEGFFLRLQANYDKWLRGPRSKMVSAEDMQ